MPMFESSGELIYRQLNTHDTLSHDTRCATLTSATAIKKVSKFALLVGLFHKWVTPRIGFHSAPYDSYNTIKIKVINYCV